MDVKLYFGSADASGQEAQEESLTASCPGPLLSWMEVSSPLNFHLEHYDGPLDLLLDLIRKQEINIYDIPIAQITAQYIEYMQRAVEMNIELSAEFVYMAATLIHIKSKNAAAARSRARKTAARGGSAQGTGRPAAGA